MLPATDTSNMTAEEAYELARGTIEATVRQFINRYARYEGRFDDMFADANMSFMEAWNCNKHGVRGGHQNFTYAVRRWVWFSLFDAYRLKHQHRRKNKFTRRQVANLDQFAGHTPPRPVRWFFEDLGSDAKLVAQLVLETPAELAKVVAAKGGNPRNWRSTLRAHLTDLGWGRERINHSFEEIAAAL